VYGWGCNSSLLSVGGGGERALGVVLQSLAMGFGALRSGAFGVGLASLVAGL